MQNVHFLPIALLEGAGRNTLVIGQHAVRAGESISVQME